MLKLCAIWDDNGDWLRWIDHEMLWNGSVVTTISDWLNDGYFRMWWLNDDLMMVILVCDGDKWLWNDGLMMVWWWQCLCNHDYSLGFVSAHEHPPMDCRSRLPFRGGELFLVFEYIEGSLHHCIAPRRSRQGLSLHGVMKLWKTHVVYMWCFLKTYVWSINDIGDLSVMNRDYLILVADASWILGMEAWTLLQ